jgi:hypothetical protein
MACSAEDLDVYLSCRYILTLTTLVQKSDYKYSTVAHNYVRYEVFLSTRNLRCDGQD